MCSIFSKCYRVICLHLFQNNSNYFRPRTKLRRFKCTFLFIKLELFQPKCIYCETVASIPLPTRDALKLSAPLRISLHTHSQRYCLDLPATDAIISCNVYIFFGTRAICQCNWAYFQQTVIISGHLHFFYLTAPRQVDWRQVQL